MEKMQKAQKKEAKPTIHWASRVSQAKLWHNIIRKAVEARGIGDYKEYFRQIDTLIPTVFKEERTIITSKAEELQKLMPEPKNIMEGKTIELDFYDGIMTIITDELEEYLKTVHIPEDTSPTEFEPGHPEKYNEGDDEK